MAALSSDSASRQAGQSSNMLKWMPREKKKDASVDISDDPLDALMFGKKDPHNKIYCVNRYVSRPLIWNQEST